MERVFNFVMNVIAVRCINSNILKLLWNEVRVPIYRTEEKDFGFAAYTIIDTKPLFISIGKMNKKEKLFATLLHEMGHHIDCKKYGNKYQTMDKKKIEKSAWKHAIRLSRKYDIPIDVEFSIYCLGTYEVSYACLGNMKKKLR